VLTAIIGHRSFLHMPPPSSRKTNRFWNATIIQIVMRVRGIAASKKRANGKRPVLGFSSVMFIPKAFYNNDQYTSFRLWIPSYCDK
jgi:hypothetical protein